MSWESRYGGRCCCRRCAAVNATVDEEVEVLLLVVQEVGACPAAVDVVQSEYISMANGVDLELLHDVLEVGASEEVLLLVVQEVALLTGAVAVEEVKELLIVVVVKVSLPLTWSCCSKCCYLLCER
eukprot:6478865-Amphidinium_carterae.2